MSKIKSAGHHWWPRSLSAYWAGADGGVTWLSPDGSERRLRPPQLGVIGNGHTIKLSHDAGPFNETFEPEFQRPDDNFPQMVDWLESLRQEDHRGRPLTERFVPTPAADDQIADLAECLISLAVRSPMNRNAAVGLAEHFRGRLPELERNAIIGLNMRASQATFTKALAGRGKYVVIASPDREFTYGDGFFHNLASPGGMPIHPKILAPLTPRLAVLLSRPMSYSTEPRMMTLQITAEEADALNLAQQVHAREAVYYRAERPPLSEHFACGEHRRFTDSRNPVDELLDHIPGVERRDRDLEDFFLSVAKS
jgi:hypothetical protein